MVRVTKGSGKKAARIALEGKLVYDNVSEIHARLVEVCAGKKSVELDLDGVTALDLSGYQLLLACMQSVEREGVSIKVRPGSCRERLQRLSEFSGLRLPFAGSDGWTEEWAEGRSE